MQLLTTSFLVSDLCKNFILIDTIEQVALVVMYYRW